MSGYPEAATRSIEVDEDSLPYPATKLVITQYLKARSDPPFWAWIIVGAFYDSDDNIIWSTEVFVAHLDIQLESDSEEESEDGGVSDAEQDDEQSSTSQSYQFLFTPTY